MSEEAPGLLPIFRSENQLRLVGEVFVHAERWWTLPGLAEAVGVSRSTVSREIGRLETAGLVVTRPVGRSLQVRANLDSPYATDLRRMMLRAYGPLPLLKRELAGLAGVDEVRVFGSWARRFAGEVGHAPQDVDVLVLGDREAMDELEVRARCATVSDLAGVTVNATVVDGEDWTEDVSAFAEEVRSAPTVLVWSADDAPSEVAG